MSDWITLRHGCERCEAPSRQVGTTSRVRPRASRVYRYHCDTCNRDAGWHEDPQAAADEWSKLWEVEE